MKGDKHVHWSKSLWETGEHRIPQHGEYFLDHSDWRTTHRSGWDGARPNHNFSDGKRTILSPYFQEPEKKIETAKAAEYPEDYTGPESCYCTACGMPPCSWCTNPDNNPELLEVAP